MKKHLPIPGASLGLVMFFIWYVPAIYVAISRTQVIFLFFWLQNLKLNFKDYRHFPTDVMAGAIIGTFTVYVSFITYYDFSLFHYQLYQKVDKYEHEPTTQESNIWTLHWLLELPHVLLFESNVYIKNYLLILAAISVSKIWFSISK